MAPASRSSEESQSPSVVPTGMSAPPKSRFESPSSSPISPISSPSSQPASFNSSSNVRSLSITPGTWEGKEGEHLLLEAHLIWFRSYGPRSQDPYKIDQCECRIFELLNDRYAMPTRRIVVRSCEHERQYVSYCKAVLLPDMLLFRTILISNEQGYLSITFTSELKIAKLDFHGQTVHIL